MRKKVLVTYSVKYCKEVELEVTENIDDILNEGIIINGEYYPTSYSYLLKNNQDVILSLPIPDTLTYDSKFGQEFEQVEYIDGSFDIESFEI